MTEIIEVNEPQVQSKIKNLIITCERLIEQGKSLDKAQQAEISLKVLQRFLKRKTEYWPLYEMFSKQESIEESYSRAIQLRDNGFRIELIKEELPPVNERPEAPTTIGCKYSFGEVIQLGTKIVRDTEKPLSWIVIDTFESYALLLAQKAVFWDVFDANGQNSWNTCTLRSKLNNEWFEETFSGQEKQIIKPFSIIKGTDNQRDNDRICVLYSDEIEKLIPGCLLKSDKVATWWTASRYNQDESSLLYYQRNGILAEEGLEATRINGVRPAVWIYAPKEVQETTDQQPTKTIAIVENIEGTFFIAPLESNELVTGSTLIKYAEESSVFSSIERAKQSALKLQQLLGTPTQSYVIDTISLPEILNQELAEKNQKKVYIDKNGNSIFSINSDRKISIETRPEDADYRYINRNGYETELLCLADDLDEQIENDFSYYSLGLRQGYYAASNCAIPNIRFEIFKAEELIQEIDEDTENQDLFSENRKYYLGYIDALKNALEIQKKYKLNGDKWEIRLVYLRDDVISPEVTEYSNFSEEYGDYKVSFYSSIPPKNFDEDKHYIYLVFVDREKEWAYRDTTLELDLPNNVELDFINDKQPQTSEKFNKLANSALKKHTTLGSGGSDYTIDPEFVQVLVNFKYSLTDEQFDNEKTEVDYDFKIGENREKQTGSLQTIKKKNKLAPFEFSQNKDLKDIKLPSSATVIPEGMFYGCVSLVDVMMPTNLQEIQDSAFEGCSSLWRAYLPNTVKKIGDRAFFGCSELKRAFLPNKLEYLGSKAFAKCSRLKTIHFPPTIKSVAEDAFEDCDSLTMIEMPYECPVALNNLDGIKISYYHVRYKVTEEKRQNIASDVAPIMNDVSDDELTETSSIADLMSIHYKQQANIPDSVIKLLEREK